MGQDKNRVGAVKANTPLFCKNSDGVSRAKQGGKLAFDTLQADLLPTVARFARRLVGRDEDSDDIVREAFLALYLNLSRLPDKEAVLPFLYRVVRNKAYDILRRQGRFEVLSGDAPTEEEAWHLSSPHPPPEEQFQRLLLWAEVQSARDRLPELQRQTLILYADEDFSYQQIAETMEVDIGTVRSRLFHARRNLTRFLRPETRQALGLTQRKETPNEQ